MWDPLCTQWSDDPKLLYIELLKRTLCRYGLDTGLHEAKLPPPGLRRRLVKGGRRLLAAAGLRLLRQDPVDLGERMQGLDWPLEAETMIGMLRLNNLQDCLLRVLTDGIPGDLIETGAWRGGATIFMRGILKAMGDRQRTVWVADSFRGLPPPDPARYPADAKDMHFTLDPLAVTVDEVKRNFERYGLLDEQVRFLEGWFKDTLPTAPIERLALLRLDGDMYQSTMEALTCLFPKLSQGGFVVVDDYGCVPGCRKAVDDYRAAQGISDPLQKIDWTGVFWRKS
jgi:O-methyltransferase